MAVLNTTPDSFYDGGRYSDHIAARRHIDELLRDGADLIDIGAESTRPGAAPVAANEQLDRALPAVEYAVAQGAIVSIDTTSPEVARAALRSGARVVNDVSCGQNPDLFRVAHEAKADLILMHSRGAMSEMPGFSMYDSEAYGDIIASVGQEWRKGQKAAIDAGLTPDCIWFDPGLGFHKSADHSFEIMRRLDEFRDLGTGLVVGASRKSFIGTLDASPPSERLGGSIAACLLALQRGASILRVHDVKASVQAVLAQKAWSPAQPDRARGRHA